MPKEERAVPELAQFLPENAFPLVAPFFRDHIIHLSLTHERKSVHGDYRSPARGTKVHRISVNATLNKYSFLITLLHEIAHLTTYVQYHNKVSPHGPEWKEHFRQVLIPFIKAAIFPKDIDAAVRKYLHDPAASTCTDPHLYKVLRHYDPHKPGWVLMEDLPPGTRFSTSDGRIFVKLEKVRTRSKCKEIATSKIYLFSGVAEVKKLDGPTSK